MNDCFDNYEPLNLPNLPTNTPIWTKNADYASGIGTKQPQFLINAIGNAVGYAIDNVISNAIGSALNYAFNMIGNAIGNAVGDAIFNKVFLDFQNPDYQPKI